MKKTTLLLLAGLTLALCGCSSTDGPLVSRDSDTDANGNAVSTSDQANSMDKNFVQGTGGAQNNQNAQVGADAGGGQSGAMTSSGGYH